MVAKTLIFKMPEVISRVYKNQETEIYTYLFSIYSKSPKTFTQSVFDHFELVNRHRAFHGLENRLDTLMGDGKVELINHFEAVFECIGSLDLNEHTQFEFAYDGVDVIFRFGGV